MQQSKFLALLSITWWALGCKNSTRLRGLSLQGFYQVLQKLCGSPEERFKQSFTLNFTRVLRGWFARFTGPMSGPDCTVGAGWLHYIALLHHRSPIILPSWLRVKGRILEESGTQGKKKSNDDCTPKCLDASFAHVCKLANCFGKLFSEIDFSLCRRLCRMSGSERQVTRPALQKIRRR